MKGFPLFFPPNNKNIQLIAEDSSVLLQSITNEIFNNIAWEYFENIVIEDDFLKKCYFEATGKTPDCDKLRYGALDVIYATLASSTKDIPRFTKLIRDLNNKYSTFPSLKLRKQLEIKFVDVQPEPVQHVAIKIERSTHNLLHKLYFFFYKGIEIRKKNVVYSLNFFDIICICIFSLALFFGATKFDSKVTLTTYIKLEENKNYKKAEIILKELFANSKVSKKKVKSFYAKWCNEYAYNQYGEQVRIWQSCAQNFPEIDIYFEISNVYDQYYLHLKTDGRYGKARDILKESIKVIPSTLQDADTYKKVIDLYEMWTKQDGKKDKLEKWLSCLQHFSHIRKDKFFEQIEAETFRLTKDQNND